MVPLSYYLIFGAILFVIGCIGALTKRNAIIILLSIELMLNGVNITLIAFSHFLNNVTGNILVVFIITVAAAEAALGLAIIINLYRHRGTLNVDEFQIMKW